MTSFYGQEGKLTDVPEEKPLSTFTYKTFSGREQTVQAHYVNFMPGHVAFCREVSEDKSLIVLAEVNTNVHELRETP